MTQYSSIEEFFPKLRETLSIPEEEEEHLINDFLSYIRAHENEFINQLRSIPLSDSDLLYGILWALGHDPNPWKYPLLDLLSRLFDEVEHAADAKPILQVIEYFDAIPDTNLDRGFLEGIVENLCRGLRSKNADVRRVAVYTIGSFVSPEDSRTIGLITKLRSDNNWKVRVNATQTFNELNDSPLNAGLSFLDKVRLRFGDPYS